MSLQRVAAAVCLLLLALAACGPASRSDERVLRIAWIHKSLGNPVFEKGREGALQRAAELSASGPVQVEVIIAGPLTADAAEQVRVVEDVIARGVDAIAMSCNDPVACVDPINKAVAAGVPVMTWDSDSPQSRRFTYLAIDNYRGGQVAADLLVEAMGRSSGKVAILSGVPGALNLEERARGFRERLRSTYPGVDVVATIASHEDINLGVRGVEETMQAHPDLAGWFFAGMWPLFAEQDAMPLWKAATRSGRLKTVAFDTLPLQLELLRDGYLSALIGQQYWGWGYNSIQIVYDRVVHRKTFPPFINSGMDIVTRENVDAMMRAWETNNFGTPIPQP